MNFGELIAKGGALFARKGADALADTLETAPPADLARIQASVSVGIAAPAARRITSSQAVAPTPGMKYAVIELQGAGGGGGGCEATATTTLAGGSSGGAGAYCKFLVTAAEFGVSRFVTIGAAGAAGAAGANAGSAGGSSSFGSLATCGGGGGGAAGSQNVALAKVGGTGAGFPADPVGVILAKNPGYHGDPAMGAINSSSNTGVIFCGNGANSLFGQGGLSRVLPMSMTSGGSIAGVGALGFGAGGSGAVGGGSGASAQPGGAGAPGIATITEYFV